MSKKLVIGLMVVALGLGLTISAKAATVEELTALIESLRSQLATLQGSTTGGASHTYAVDLTVGSNGADVTALQTFLVGKGMLTMPAGVAMGNFGPLTKAAVARYQASVGLPATGFVGPLTRANLNSLVSTGGNNGSNGGDNSSATLEGDNGEIAGADQLSQLSSEEVGAGQTDVKVAGVELEASSDGDIALMSVKLNFDPTGNTGSTRLNRYIQGVKVWIGDEEVGSADVEDFTKNSSGIYTKTVSLDNAVIKADEKVKMYITVDAATTIDSGDVTGDSWTVDIDNIRYEDGSGVVTTDTSTGDINAMNVAINFTTFSTAADTELKFSAVSGNPAEGIVIVSATQDTEDVSLLKGKMKLEGTSDVLVDTLPVTFTVSGTATGLASTTGTIKLKLGGEEYSESIGSGHNSLTETVTFDNLDYTIEAGDTVEFEVLADIGEVDGDPIAEGDTVKASVTASNIASMDAENDQGDQLADTTEKTGAVTGKNQILRTAGISVTKLSENFESSDTTGANNDLGTFTLKYRVTNSGDDAIYVSSLVEATTTNALVTVGKAMVVVDRADTGTTGGVSVSLTNNTDTDKETSGVYAIEAGEYEDFTVTATVSLPSAGDSGLFRLSLANLYWDTDSTDPTPDNRFNTNLGIGESVSTDSHGLN